MCLQQRTDRVAPLLRIPIRKYGLPSDMMALITSDCAALCVAGEQRLVWA